MYNYVLVRGDKVLVKLEELDAELPDFEVIAIHPPVDEMSGIYFKHSLKHS